MVAGKVCLSPTNGTVLDLIHLPPLSVPWHQNTYCRIKQQHKALLKTLHAQYLSTSSGACILKNPSMYLSEAFLFFCLVIPIPINQVCPVSSSPGLGRANNCWTPWIICRRKSSSSQGEGWGALCTLTDFCGRMSCVRHPFRLVCTHSIYKCHPPLQHDHIKPSQTDYCRHITHVNWQISFY